MRAFSDEELLAAPTNLRKPTDEELLQAPTLRSLFPPKKASNQQGLIAPTIDQNEISLPPVSTEVPLGSSGGPPPAEAVTEPQGVPQDESRSEFGKGWSRGIGELGALAKGAGGLVASGLKAITPDAIEPEFLTTLENAGLSGYTEDMKQIEEDKALAAKVGGIEDIRLTEEGGLGRLGDWAMSTLGEGLPMVLSSVIGGGVGAVAGRAAVGAGVKALAKGAAEKVIASQAAKTAATLTGEELAALSATNAAVATGATIGAGAVNLGLEGGGIFGDIFEKTGEKAPGTALVFGSIAAALDTITPMRVLKGLGVGGLAKKGIGEIIAKNSGLWTRLVKEIPKASAVEGITEGLQAVVEEAAVQWVDENQKFLDFSKDQYMGFLNEAAAGTLLGMAMAPLSAGKHGHSQVKKEPGAPEGTVQPEVVPPAEVKSPENLQEQVQPIAPEPSNLTEQIEYTPRPEDVLTTPISAAENASREAPAQEHVPVVAPAQENVSVVAPVPENTLAKAPIPELIEPTPQSTQESPVQPQEETGIESHPAPAPFRSGLAEAVSAVRQNKASGNQWMNMLKGASGVKAEEIEDTGLEPWLREQGSVAVSKDKILGFLAEKRPVLEDVEKQTEKTGFLYQNQTALRLSGPSENYQEMIVKGPNLEPFEGEDSTHFGDKTGQKGLAWIRGDERVDTEGKTGFLVDEVQSKRHQAGRNRGYFNTEEYKKEIAHAEDEAKSVSVSPEDTDAVIQKTISELSELNPKADLNKIVDQFDAGLISKRELLKEIDNAVATTELEGNKDRSEALATKLISRALGPKHDKDKQWYTVFLPDGTEFYSFIGEKNKPESEILQDVKTDYINKAREDIQWKYEGKAPDAPFKKGWPLLMMKKAIGEAASKGLDRVYWTTGQIQSDWYKGHSEAALKRFYDQELPREVGAYIKKFGGKVFQTALDDGKGGQHTVWAIDITPELKKEVLEKGATLYAKPQADANNPQRVSPAKLTQHIKSEPGYVYHATSANRLYEIADSGRLVPQRPSYGTDQDRWPDGGRERRSYFSRKAEVVWSFAPEEGKPVVVRVKESGDFRQESGTEDIFFVRPIPITQLEYLGEDESWHSVTNLREDKNASMGMKRNVPSNDKIFTSDVSQVRKRLSSLFGESFITTLEQKGILKYSDDVEKHGALGLFNRGTQTVTLFPQNILKNKEDPVGVFLHEGGGHQVLPTMLGNSFKNLQESFDRLLAEGNPAALAAQKRAEESSLKPEHIQEERIAYFIQEAWGRIQNRQDIGQAYGLFTRIVNAIKAWFRTTEFGKHLASQGIDFELTDEYAVALAKRAVSTLTSGVKHNQPSWEVFGSFIGLKGFNRAKDAGLTTPGLNTAADRAKMFMRARVDPTMIWRSTGWFMDTVDKKMKFEVPDTNARLNSLVGQGVEINGESIYRLEAVLDHPELYKYYPQLRNIRVAVLPDGALPAGRAYTRFVPGAAPEIRMSKQAVGRKATLLHEIQHIIQYVEGFAIGGSSNTVDLLDQFALEKVERSTTEGATPELYRLLVEFKNNFETIKNLHDARGRLNTLFPTFTDVQKESAQEILNRIETQLETYQANYGYLFYRLLHGEAESREVEARSKLSPTRRMAIPPRALLGGGSIDPETGAQSENYATIAPGDTILRQLIGIDTTWAEHIDAWKEHQKEQDTQEQSDQNVYDESLREDVLASRPLNGSAILHPIDFAFGHDTEDLSWFERFRIWMQDAFHALDIKQQDIENTLGRPIPSGARAYQKVSAFHNISTYRINKLRADFHEKILKIIQESKLSFDDVDSFLYARSAPQANELLRRRRSKILLKELLADPNVGKTDVNRIKKEMKDALNNAKAVNTAGVTYIKRRQLGLDYLKILNNNLNLASPDLVTRITDFLDRPSGMSDGDADTISKQFAQSPNYQALQDIGTKIDEMNRFVVDELVNSHMLSRKQAIAWNNYQHYVMLKRSGYEEHDSAGTGSGFSASRPSKLRIGSTRRAVNILANTLANAEAQIVRAEKNLTVLGLVGLVSTSPDKNFWELVRAQRTEFLDENGFAQFGDTKFVGENDVVFWLDGKPNLVSFNPADKRAMSIARAFKKLDVPRIKGPLLAMRAFNHWLALVNTALSPEFLLTNLPRDFLTASFNIGASEADKVRSLIYSNYTSSFKALRLLLRTDTTNSTDPLVLDAKRFVAAGGKMDWAESYRNIEQRKSALERRVKEMTPHTMQHYKRLTASLIEDYNSIGENMTRLAAFRALTADPKDGGLGMSDARAVEITNELTVHFSRKGTAGDAINALYLFANAGIQGSAIILTNIAKSAKVRRYVYGAIVSSFLIDMINRALSDDDDRGRNLYDEIPENVKKRNLVFAIPGTSRFLTIPAPWGYNVFWVAGSKLGEMTSHALGQKKDFSFAAAGATMFDTALNAFVPFSSGSLMQSLSPTLLDPLVMIGENVDPFGNPLRPEKYPNQIKPDSQLYWSSASTVSKTIAEFANEITGGDKVKSGLIDVSPNVLDMWASSLFGSIGKQALLLSSATAKIASGEAEDLELSDIPVVRKLTTTTKASIDPMKYHQNVANVLTLKAQLKEYRTTDPEYVEKLKTENAGLRRMFMMTTVTEERLSFLRQRKKIAQRAGDLERERLLDEKIKNIQAHYNDVFDERVLAMKQAPIG